MFAGTKPSQAPCHFSSVTSGNLAISAMASSEYGPVMLSAWKKGCTVAQLNATEEGSGRLAPRGLADAHPSSSRSMAWQQGS